MKQIYAYTDLHYPGWIKVGETIRNPEERVREQYITIIPCPPFPYSIVFTCDAVKVLGKEFSDHNVHDMLCALGVKRGYGEWFLCDYLMVKKACELLMSGETPESVWFKN